MPAQAIPSRYALELKHNRSTDQDISLGENAFEGSDDICHPLTLWEVCVQVAGSMGGQPPICRACETKRRPAWGTGGADAVASLWGIRQELKKRQRQARVAGLS